MKGKIKCDKPVSGEECKKKIETEENDAPLMAVIVKKKREKRN